MTTKNNKSYAEYAAEARTEEYAWITTPEAQELSDNLDKATRQIDGYSWRNMIAEYGHEAAARELDERKFCFGQELLRREHQAELDEAAAPLRAFQEENHYYLTRDRFWPVTTRETFAYVQKQDAAFIEEQKASGFSTEELEHCIALLQKENLEYIARELDKKRCEQQAEADRRRKKDEADQRFAKSVTVAAEKMFQKMILDVIASGVFRGK